MSDIKAATVLTTKQRKAINSAAECVESYGRDDLATTLREVLAHAGKAVAAEAPATTGIEELTWYQIDSAGDEWPSHTGNWLKRADVEPLLAHAGVTAEPTAQVPAAEVRAALEMARSYIDATSTEPGYGFAQPDNPHDFHPDAESCSADEIAAHKAACDAYDKGEYTPERGSEWVGAMHILRAPWGIGAYTMRDEQAVKVLAAIDNALAQQSTADKASEVRAAEWISVEDQLPEPGMWLVAVETDDGMQVHSLELNKKRQWMHEGEPTFCHGYYFDPKFWRPLPAAPSTADSAGTGAMGEGAE